MADAEVMTAEQAHEIIGGFLVRCSLMNYRSGQMIARWFSEDERFKPLGYVMHNLSFSHKKDVVALRLTTGHPEADAVRAVMEEADAIMQRRDLVANGLLSGGPKGSFSIKSHSAARFLMGSGEVDILPVSEIPAWSARAVAASEEIVRLADFMKGRADRA